MNAALVALAAARPPSGNESFSLKQRMLAEMAIPDSHRRGPVGGGASVEEPATTVELIDVVALKPAHGRWFATGQRLGLRRHPQH